MDNDHKYAAKLVTKQLKDNEVNVLEQPSEPNIRSLEPNIRSLERGEKEATQKVFLLRLFQAEAMGHNSKLL